MGLAGVICPMNFLPRRPSGGGCGIGKSERSGWKSGAFLSELNEREQQLDWSEYSLEGSLVPAKGGVWSRKKQAAR